MRSLARSRWWYVWKEVNRRYQIRITSPETVHTAANILGTLRSARFSVDVSSNADGRPDRQFRAAARSITSRQSAANHHLHTHFRNLHLSDFWQVTHNQHTLEENRRWRILSKCSLHRGWSCRIRTRGIEKTIFSHII